MNSVARLPQGFSAIGLYCGIKSDPQKPDLSLFVSDRPAVAAGVFTQNRVCGAPVHVSRRRVPSSTARAVVINSGNSNAATGAPGIADAEATTRSVAELLQCHESAVLVCSTGVIGHRLPMQTLLAGLPKAVANLGDSSEAFVKAARGMMTTDTVPKQAERCLAIGGVPVLVSGAAKGAAMIAPNMATMLAVVMTDATLDPETAQEMLRTACDQSFNRISVDGHTSTSDTVILLANGAANAPMTGPETLTTVQNAIIEVCRELSQAIIRDAEGATHFVTIDVSGLPTVEECVIAGKAVANSPLVKTAIAGADPNWGRIVSAVGYSGIEYEEQSLSLSINGVTVYERGLPAEFDEQALSASIKSQVDTSLVLTFGTADCRATIHTCDLTAEYVRLNADYTT